MTVWSDYYLSNTAWTISTTPWTNVVNVWKAVSATWIDIKKIWLKNETIVTPTVWASPYTYQNTTWKTQNISITWWTVSQVAISSDNATYYQVSRATNISTLVRAGDYIKVTYTVVPTMKNLPFN